MKVLHVTNRLYPEYSGGTEIHIYDLCVGLRNKIETVLFSLKTVSSEFIKSDFISENGLKKYHLTIPVTNNKRKLFEVLFLKKIKLILMFWKIISTEKPDIVHFHHLIDLSGLLVIMCRFRKIPVILDLVDYWFLCPGTYMMCKGDAGYCSKKCIWENNHSFFAHLVRKYSNRLIINVYSNFTTRIHRHYWKYILNNYIKILLPISTRQKDLYQMNGIDAKMIVKPCGIKPFRSGSVRVEKENIVVGYIGAVSRIKGVDILVKAFRGIDMRNLRLNIYGQNNFALGYLESIINTDKRISLLGPVDHKLVPKILNSLDILVVPSIWEEAFGIILSEGQYAGVKVIVSSIGGMTERLKDRVNGYLFRSGSVSSLRNKIMLTIKSPSAYKYSFAKSSVFLIRQEIKQLRTIYKSILSGSDILEYKFSKDRSIWETI